MSDDDEGTVDRMLEFAARTGIRKAEFAIFTPYPGTPGRVPDSCFTDGVYSGGSLAGLATGHAQSDADTSRQFPLDLSLIDSLNRNVVAADFNGDGIIDLAASAVPSPDGNISSTATPAVSAANGSTAPGIPTVDGTATPTAANGVTPVDTSTAAGGPTVSVFGNGISVPNGSATAPAAAMAGGGSMAGWMISTVGAT